MNTGGNREELREHRQRIASMFDGISPWYDFLNHTLSLGLDIHWRKKLLQTARAHSTARVLDLAAGTLDVSRELERLGTWSEILAMDLSRSMLQRGRRKVGPTRVLPVCADALSIPLPARSVDCVTIAFGIRNIRPREAAYAEILRILASRGRLCILEFGSGQQKIWGGLYNFYLRKILPFIGRVVSSDLAAYTYLAQTIREFPSAENLKHELLESGFSRVRHRPLTSGIVCLHIAEK